MSEKRVVRTEAAPAPFQGAPYSQAIVANGFVFVAGQLAFEPGSTEIVGDTIEEQTERVFANLGAIQGMNEVYARHVGDQPPARSTIEISRLPPGALVEIEAIAHL